ncbi:hypothetical protein GCM10009730_51290 [Streptomyces albidochromogenes]
MRLDDEAGRPVLQAVGSDTCLSFRARAEVGEQAQRGRRLRAGEHEADLAAEQGPGRCAVVVDGQPREFGRVESAADGGQDQPAGPGLAAGTVFTPHVAMTLSYGPVGVSENPVAADERR